MKLFPVDTRYHAIALGPSYLGFVALFIRVISACVFICQSLVHLDCHRLGAVVPEWMDTASISNYLPSSLFPLYLQQWHGLSGLHARAKASVHSMHFARWTAQSADVVS